MSAGPRRVGFLTSGWWPEVGGVQGLTRGLAGELGGRGYRVFALASDRSELAANKSEELVEGVQVRRVRVDSRDQQSLDSLSRVARLEEEVVRWKADRCLDLIHVHSLDPWGLGVPVRLEELGVPVLWTWHDYWALCPRGQMWHFDGHSCEEARPQECAGCVRQTWPQLSGQESAERTLAGRMEMMRRALGACSRVFTPSISTREIMIRHGIPEDRVEVRQNGISTLHEVERLRTEQLVRVGYLGSVQPSKGVLELARWISELGHPFQLEVHGPCVSYHGDMAYVRKLEALSSREPRIKMKGAYDAPELPEILAGLDLVAVPSLWEEVMGLVAREARSSGLPVFVSKRGGLPDGGFHELPAGDGEAWKDALLRFGRDQAWRAELRALPFDCMGLEGMAVELQADYEALIGG
jgi:glycosyltransferase involved in cell wall biosynthesis